MEHLAETMTDFLLRRKYITEEQTEWCHYMLHHPLTDQGIEKFKADYIKVFGE